MDVRYKQFLLRAGFGASVIGLFSLAAVTLLSLLVGWWIYCRFGTVPVWLIFSCLHESPSVLPTNDILLLCSAILVSLLYGFIVDAAYVVLGRHIYRRKGKRNAVLFALGFIAFLLYGSVGVFDVLDDWFAIRYDVACRSAKSDYFKSNFHRVDPAEISFGATKRNLVLIVSESLEEGFAEGAIGGENLLPNLTRWRTTCHHADCQCQVTGSSFTAAAQTSLFYGIPRLRLDGSVMNQNTERYPRFAIPSIWDVFLSAGYKCSFVHGGDFKFGALGKMLPEREGFNRIGFDDMCTDPDYLKEPHKLGLGANDEVMFKHLKREILRVSGSGSKFMVMGQTINTHCPVGWCSAFAPKGDRWMLAESILAQDRLIAEFLDWFGDLECAKDTVVVILGDHHYWARKFEGKSPRRVFNAVRVPGITRSPFVRTRKFATFDWAPTFIELAGGKLPGDGHFGMGVSLLRDAEALLENISVEEFDSKMQSSLSDYWDIVLRNN